MEGTLNWNSKWLPQFGWVVENERIHTRLNVCPHVFTDQSPREYEAYISLHEGDRKPLYEMTSPRLRLGDVWRMEFRDVIGKAGRSSLNSLLLIRAREVDVEPRQASVLLTYLDWYSDDGTVDFRINASQANGHRAGHYRTGCYEVFPGIPGDPDYRMKLVILNFQWSSVPFRFDLFGPTGEHRESPEMTVSPFSAQMFEFEEFFPGYRDFIGHPGQGAIRIWTQYRVIAYVLFENARSGAILALDHLTRYFGRPRRILSSSEVYFQGLRSSAKGFLRRIRGEGS